MNRHERRKAEKLDKQTNIGSSLYVPRSYNDARIFSAGILEGRKRAIQEYNSEIAPLRNHEKAAFGRFMVMVGKINEVGQLGRGQTLMERLKVLSPEWTKAATVYKDSLVMLKPKYPADPYLEEIIEGVMMITSQITEAVNSALQGDNGEALRALHKGDTDWWGSIFEIFMPSVERGGRPRGLTQHLSLIYKGVREQLPSSEQTKQTSLVRYGRELPIQIKKQAEQNGRDLSDTERNAINWIDTKNDDKLQSELRDLLARGDHY